MSYITCSLLVVCQWAEFFILCMYLNSTGVLVAIRMQAFFNCFLLVTASVYIET